VVLNGRQLGADGLEHRPVGPGHQQRVSLRHDPGGDRRRLLRGLAQPEHDFREALPCRAVVIHAGEAQILEGLRTEPARQLVDGGVEGQLATGHAAKNRADFGGCHRRQNRLRSLISLTLRP
jgi:hypothetical protein